MRKNCPNLIAQKHLSLMLLLALVAKMAITSIQETAFSIQNFTTYANDTYCNIRDYGLIANSDRTTCQSCNALLSDCKTCYQNKISCSTCVENKILSSDSKKQLKDICYNKYMST